MGRKSNETTIEVHEGVYLKFLGDVYHCYFRIAGKQIRKTMNTADLGVAKLKALQLHKATQFKLDSGEEVETVSFTKLKRFYLENLKGKGPYKYHSETLDRHFLPYFVRFNDVARIKRSDILDYVKFRRGKGDQSPTPQTLNRENTVLRQLLRYAVDRNWIKVSPKIENESERLTRRRRRHFNLQEYLALNRAASKRIAELEGIPLKTRQMEQRQLLFDYIKLMANTGLRVDESKTLIWRNVDFENGTLLLEHAGKTKSTRRVIMRKSAADALMRIKERRLQYLEKHGGELSDNEKVVALPDGRFINSFKKGFDQLLAAAGFKYEQAHEKHSPTSLRHTYATFRLTATRGNRATVRSLALQMGTSDKMIQQHYGHDSVDDYRDELAG
jgi:integrase